MSFVFDSVLPEISVWIQTEPVDWTSAQFFDWTLAEHLVWTQAELLALL